MNEVSIIGLDLGKNVFQVHGAVANGEVVFRKKPSRDKLLTFFSAQRPAIVGWKPVAALTSALGRLQH